MRHVHKSFVRIPASRASGSATWNLGFNASMLDDHPTGVGVFAHNLANQLESITEKDNRYRLTAFTPTRSNLDEGMNLSMIPAVMCSSKYGKFAAATRLLWNLLAYPIAGRHMDLLINPTTHGTLGRQPQILTIHDLLSLRYKNISTHQRIYFSMLLPTMIQRSLAVVAVSESTKKDIITFFNCPDKEIRVIYNGYDRNRYRQMEGGSGKIAATYGVSNYFLAVGPTYPHKNYTILLQAYAQLPEAVRRAHPLVITGGKEPYLSSILKEAGSMGITANLHYLGYVPLELMPALYNEAYALTFPSIHEGFGFPLLEAMACGCPVITSQASSMPEVCGQAAWYFNPQDHHALNALMLRMVKEPGSRDQMIRKGLDRATFFSWEKTAKGYLDLAGEILNNRTSKIQKNA